MAISQKCQYALRAVFELAKHYGQGPVKIADIAKAQAIPLRFLEVILSQLRQGGFAGSRRGNEGGYLLVRSPREFATGHIPGAYNLEDSQVPYRLEELMQLKDREIVVYCEVGPRARWVEVLLKQEGFTNVKHLLGDFSGWRRNGNPIE